MKTFVLAASWWCDCDIQMSIIKANSRTEVLKQFILQHEEEPLDCDWTEDSIDEYLCGMEVTCEVIEIPSEIS